MAEKNGVLFVPYKETLGLLSVADALKVCEDVYRMHARDSVVLSNPPSFKLDVADGFHNHWHVKSVFLKDIPATGVRVYNYFDDGVRNAVGGLDCTRYIVLADPKSGVPLAIVDEHWSYAIRSTAAAVLACKWVGPRSPKVLGLVGIGTMGANALRCLATMYEFDEIRCTSRRPQTRAAFAQTWSKELGTRVVARVDRGGGARRRHRRRRHHVARHRQPGALAQARLHLHLARAPRARSGRLVEDGQGRDRQLGINMLQKDFRRTVESGLFSRAQLPWRDPRARLRREEGARARR